MTDDDKKTNTLLTCLWIGLGYGYLRLIYELVTALTTSTALYYLVCIILGLHALQFWLRQTRAAQAPAGSSVTTIQTIALAILLVALVMDAGRLVLTLVG